MKTRWIAKDEMRKDLEKSRQVLHEQAEKYNLNFLHEEVLKISKKVDHMTDIYRLAFDPLGQVELEKKYILSIDEINSLATDIAIKGHTIKELISEVQRRNGHESCFAEAAACIEECEWKYECMRTFLKSVKKEKIYLKWFDKDVKYFPGNYEMLIAKFNNSVYWLRFVKIITVITFKKMIRDLGRKYNAKSVMIKPMYNEEGKLTENIIIDVLKKDNEYRFRGKNPLNNQYIYYDDKNIFNSN